MAKISKNKTESVSIKDFGSVLGRIKEGMGEFAAVIKDADVMSNYLFVLPAFLLFVVFGLYPFFKVFQLSTMSWDGLSSYMTFVGMQNFKEVFSDKVWWASVMNASWITFLALTIQNGMALILALMCAKDIRGGHVYRVIFYLPPVLSGIVIGLIWKWIFRYPDGILNFALVKMGMQYLVRDWLSDPATALNAVAVIHMWRGFGWGFVILLAGLQNIPQQIYEAARVDGANPWHRFIYITVPLMIPVFILVSILTILGSMQIYDIIVATTNGGPSYHTEVPVTRILASMQGAGRFGYACAQGIVFGVILLAVSMIQLWMSKKMKQE